ncbi:multiple sugar transport system substrate-binding protein [Thermocatellispora tengchongensis]|uniref:Multiple sugar transport system substrate-binding protein n=1 Tax=Thermocatellispora tengchongensis TaxID=1073253 RepID=A0A840NZV6_9ACTN|nr:sugar ABC transporter substrate-binding protein [Thermocatellispora tengchongensis]MBB5134464.1 multiple sugar transport system substrate-binding protein [Thermocatellispora tengchongensis]
MRLRSSAALLGVVLAVSACSGGNEPATTAAGSQERVTLSYAVWDNNQKPVMEELAAEFTKTHPNIAVNVQLTPWTDYWTKLKAAVTGGEIPDVFWMNGPNFQLYASNGVIRPIEEQVDTSVYPKPLVDLYTYEGKLYGLPKDMDTVGVWYNKELFDAAKVKYPADDWTWADFREAAAKLTDPGKGVYAVGAQLTSFQEYQYNTIAQAGGYVISPDGRKSGYADPKTIEGLRFWTDLIDKKQSPDLKTMTDTVPLAMFEAGKLAMYWGGSWNVAEFSANSYTKDKVDVAPLPRGEKQATIIHGVANVMSAKTEHPAEAWEFVKFLGSRQAAEILGKKGPIPAYTGTQSAWVSAHPEFKLQTFLDSVAYAQPYPVSKNTAAWNEAELTYLTKAWAGEQPVEQAAADLAKAMDELLAKE